MIKKWWMIVSASHEYPRRLADWLEGEEALGPIKVVANYRSHTIEMPHTYVRDPDKLGYIIMTGQNQAIGLIVHLSLADRSYYSSGFAKVFNIPRIGILTEWENLSEEKIQRGREELLNTGVEEVYLWPSKELELFREKIIQEGKEG